MLGQKEEQILDPPGGVGVGGDGGLQLGGRVGEREPGRYEVIEVPFAVRTRDAKVGVADPVLRSYERICFEKDLCSVPGTVPLMGGISKGEGR